METMLAAALIFNPVGLVIAFLIPTIAIVLTRTPDLPAIRLAAGYIGALCALAVVVAMSSYVSPEEAVSVWHIPPDRYWNEIVVQFVATFVVAAFITLVGISLVGMPVLLCLSRRGKATAPWLLVMALAISAVAATLLYGVMHSSSSTFFEILSVLIVSHVVSAAGFALAAGLPWTFASKL